MNIDRSKKVAGAIGGKTARACENCLVKRARWFCSADEAFLCQACDSSVHSANLLASKHERFRLETSSCKTDHYSSPAWHKGFAKKPRTPRQPKKLLRGSSLSSHFLQTTVVDTVVPEINCEEYGPFHHQYDEKEEQSACMVPVFEDTNFQDDYFRSVGTVDDDDLDIGELFTACDADSFFGVSNKDLGLRRAVFESEGDEADVERNENKREVKKTEGDEESELLNAFHYDPMLGVEMDWDFDCHNNNGESMAGGISSETKVEDVLDEEATRNMFATDDHRRYDHHQSKEGLYEKRTNNNTLLRLDCEAVIAAWAGQGESPWIDGARPHQFNIDEFKVNECLGKLVRSCDGEREARVSRYREKRRTRLFSKKIRYQVRKLNAEKRPRVKGRFVKRTSMTAISYHPPYSFM